MTTTNPNNKIDLKDIDWTAPAVDVNDEVTDRIHAARPHLTDDEVMYLADDITLGNLR